MRSHAKASSAGSTQGQGSRQGSFVRGVGVTRATSRDGDGSGAPSHRGRVVLAALAASLLALALLASPAFASKQLLSDFGTLAGSGSFGGDLNNPRDVGVNSAGIGPASLGDVYVADETNNRIERFDASGNFVSAWGKDTIASSMNERQKIVVEATGGSYTLSFEGFTTPSIPFGATGLVQSELESLPSIGSGNVSVAGLGTPANPLIITFKGSLAGSNQPTITADTSDLTGTVSISTIANGKPSVSDDTGTGFEICTVATECQVGTPSGENGALDHPQSVAVDEDTGNVYVSDRGNRRVDEYDGEGNFIRSFGWDVVESGPDNTGTEYEVCNEAESDVCKSGEGGSGVGQYGTGEPENGFGIAISPEAGNASTGTVYLADSGNQRIDTFNLDGTSPASFGSSLNFGTEQPRSVAVDSRGIVYASDSNNNGDIQRYDSLNANGNGVGFLAPIVPPNNEVQEISFTGLSSGDAFKLTCPNGTQTEELLYATGTGFSGQLIGQEIIKNGLEAACGANTFSLSGEPPYVTVAFKGSLAASNQPQMTCTVLSGSGSCSITTTSDGHPGPLLGGAASSATTGLAVNPAGTALYVLRTPFSGPTVVQQLGPVNEPGLSAAPVATDDTHGAEAGFGAVRGFGFDGTVGRLYVSVNNDPDGPSGPLISAHRVYVFADSSALLNPTASMPLDVGAITAIADRSATFHGEVDPKGGLVSCTFQYSTDEINWTDVSAPGCATLSENGGEQNIGQSVQGLVPDQKYFVRLQVTRPYFPSFTPVTSTNVPTFTTASGSPVLAGVSALAVDEHSVRIVAMIDPSHSPTSYAVQYGATPSLGSSTAPVQIGKGTSNIEVSSVISGLDPATQYYFKLVATNLVGSTVGEPLAIATYATPPSFSPCANYRYRTGPSAQLPDCRAYEQVTPADKTGADAYGSPYTVEASNSGDGITFYTLAGFPGGESFQENNVFLSRFSGGEWSTAGLTPPPSYGDEGIVRSWTPDLRLSFATDLSLDTFNSSVVLRESANANSHVLIPPTPGFTAIGFTLGGAFADDSRIVFSASGHIPVTSGPSPISSAANVYLYNRETGELTVAGLLPASACAPAAPPCIAESGSRLPSAFESYVGDGHVVSANGDIYFIDTSSNQLYLRREAAESSASTVQVSASVRTDCADHAPCSETPEPDPAGTFPPTFMGATPDGSHVFFRSRQKLTNNSMATAGVEDLYRFDTDRPVGQRLTDIAPGAKVVGVLGYSNSGARVYFAANADLDGGGPAAMGNCSGGVSGKRVSLAGSCSLYLWQAAGVGACATGGGCVKFVAKVDAGESGEGQEGDGYDWTGLSKTEHSSNVKVSRVSADGRSLIFRSKRQLTDYDNYGSGCAVHQAEYTPGPCPEFYRYDAESEQISCVTCDPTGTPPIGAPELKNPDLYHAPSTHSPYSAQAFLSRNLSPDGDHFFFESPDKLVPTDVNGDQGCHLGRFGVNPELGVGWPCLDVYEWEAPGTPGSSCAKDGPAYSPANGGCVYLLSTGTGAYPSYLADVSESGDTAFIFSRQKLVPFDEDTQEDIYAVKVDGGLAYQHAVRPAACEGDSCRSASSQASDAPGAGTAAFEGPGNPKSNTNATGCPKGKRTVRSKGKVRCVARHTKKHRKQRRHHRRAANNDRRASR